MKLKKALILPLIAFTTLFGCTSNKPFRYSVPYGMRRPMREETRIRPETEGKLTPVTSANFEELVLNRKGYVIVDIWQNYCHPCDELKLVLENLARRYHNVSFFTFADNWDDDDRAIRRYVDLSALTLPRVLIFKNGEFIREINGAEERKLLPDMIKNFARE
ncbi:MAG: thioredoxin family protein [Candidatus Micrarchaeota archaeon]|nr:thioredoxin family protein [Candidatus Micrarchaeota archaeon]